jgi:formamidopyrimidine-DNA glycosylase
MALGVEPLNGAFGAGALKHLFKGRRAPVHALLLNQRLIAGLGNIYATEALYRARIRPTRPAGRIPEGGLRALAEGIRGVLAESIRNRGYSMSTYVDALGRKGKSQLFTQCYGKQDSPCPSCGDILKRKVISGRGVAYCPRCQR